MDARRAEDNYGIGLELRTTLAEGEVHVEARGELDVSTADAVTKALIAAESAAAGTIVLDLSAVTFIDSTGLRMLLEADERARHDRRRLRIVSSPAVERLVDLSGLRDRLNDVLTTS